MVTYIEELSLNAWPSIQTVLLDGWILRFANGYTRRANSINPLYPSTIDPDEKISFCERIYQSRNLPTVFKITPKVYPGDLDKRLTEHGYRKDAITSVQIMELGSVNSEEIGETNIQENLTDDWIESYCRMSAVAEPQRETLRQILINIVPHCVYVSILSDDRVVACGLGVYQSGYVGLFDIITDSAYRCRGWGQKVVESILAWGKQNGGQKAYLQVMLNNPPALHLYSKVGFVEKYQYWYRAKS